MDKNRIDHRWHLARASRIESEFLLHGKEAQNIIGTDGTTGIIGNRVESE
jgi:hypothetical protein